MTDHRVRARLALLRSNDGGLATPLPSGTRSLLLWFAALDGSDDAAILGALITLGDAQEALRPGSSYADVELLFWVDVARLYATACSNFKVWYGRVVGSGTVTVICDS